jgi:hypothetical protein
LPKARSWAAPTRPGGKDRPGYNNHPCRAGPLGWKAGHDVMFGQFCRPLIPAEGGAWGVGGKWVYIKKNWDSYTHLIRLTVDTYVGQRSAVKKLNFFKLRVWILENQNYDFFRYARQSKQYSHRWIFMYTGTFKQTITRLDCPYGCINLVTENLLYLHFPRQLEINLYILTCF